MNLKAEAAAKECFLKLAFPSVQKSRDASDIFSKILAKHVRRSSTFLDIQAYNFINKGASFQAFFKYFPYFLKTDVLSNSFLWLIP